MVDSISIEAGLDRTAEASATSRAAQRDPAFEALFLRSKSQMLRTSPLHSLRERRDLHSAFEAQIGPSAQALTQPIPGGVGYGTFFDPAFRQSFGAGTAIRWCAVCPPVPGGNVSSYLYVTSTNRAATGVEALISYAPGKSVEFLVFDWARQGNDRFRYGLAPDLRPYIQPKPFNGQTFPVLAIWNATDCVGPNQWRNSVWLFDAQQKQWALIYRYVYSAADGIERTGWPGSWGPIVETFQPVFHGTAPLGALDVQLQASNESGVWGPWSNLLATEAPVRADNVGFSVTGIDANYDWVVQS